MNATSPVRAEPLSRLWAIQQGLFEDCHSVSDEDLLIFLLRRSLPIGSAAATAEALLHRIGGLKGLGDFGRDHARALKLDHQTSAILLAAAELARRRVLWELKFAGDHEDVVLNRYLRGAFASGDQEILGAAFLGPSRRCLGVLEIFRGRLTETAFDPKPMLREALRLNASGVLLAHCQPKRDSVWTSREIGLVLKRAQDACRSVGIELVDFRVLGTYYVSLCETGPW